MAEKVEMTVGDRIAYARSVAKISTNELQRRISAKPRRNDKKPGSSGSVSKYESGFMNPKPKALERLAAALGVEKAWLTYGSGPMTPNGDPGPSPCTDDDLATTLRYFPHRWKKDIRHQAETWGTTSRVDKSMPVGGWKRALDELTVVFHSKKPPKTEP
jgi:transcriptional regulator with XRE-family HTH domain